MWPPGALGYTGLGISWRSVRNCAEMERGEKQNQAMERVKRCVCVCACACVCTRTDIVILTLPTTYVPGASHTLALLILTTSLWWNISYSRS